MEAEIERLRTELAELVEARDAVSAALFEIALDSDIGYALLAEDLRKYREIHRRLAAALGVKYPWEVEGKIELIAARAAGGG